MGVVPLIRCQSEENETMGLDNRGYKSWGTSNRSGNESQIRYSDESKTPETDSERKVEGKGVKDEEQNNSNS